MPDIAKNELGLIERPLPSSARSAVPLLGAPEALPRQYIVPFMRHWFDANFKPIPLMVSTLPTGELAERNQGWLDRCVGEAFALQKSSHEGVMISPKDAWAVAKAIDAVWGYPKSSYGATAWAGAEAIKRGAASEALVPSGLGSLTREQHMDESWVNDAVRADRAKHAGQEPFFVPRTEIQRTLFVTGHPVATHCTWYTDDNDIGRNGRTPFMRMPQGTNVGGHMFAVIGWIEHDGIPSLVAANSWSRAWGWHGLFLIPLQGVMDRLGNGYVHVDADTENLADLLARYDGKDVRLVGTPDLYRCEFAVMRKYPNEIVWWSHGKKFGFDTVDITPEEFAVIPRGQDMELGHFAEVVRQIRASVGLN